MNDLVPLVGHGIDLIIQHRLLRIFHHIAVVQVLILIIFQHAVIRLVSPVDIDDFGHIPRFRESGSKPVGMIWRGVVGRNHLGCQSRRHKVRVMGFCQHFRMIAVIVPDLAARRAVKSQARRIHQIVSQILKRGRNARFFIFLSAPEAQCRFPLFPNPYMIDARAAHRAHILRNQIGKQHAQPRGSRTVQRRFIHDVRIAGMPGSAVADAAFGVVNLHQHRGVPAGHRQTGKTVRNIQRRQFQACRRAEAFLCLVFHGRRQQNTALFHRINHCFTGCTDNAQRQRKNHNQADCFFHGFSLLNTILMESAHRRPD